jgi:hypothetical protein
MWLMPYTKSIVCLANSKKIGGRCVAGRVWDGQAFGDWVRPVSALEKGELHRERLCSGNHDPQLLEIVDVPLLDHRPVGCQTENHLVDTSRHWTWQGSITSVQVLAAVQRVDGPLWINAGSTQNGENDHIPAGVAAGLPNSLMLIRPPLLRIVLGIEGVGYRPRRKIRGHFSVGGHNYVLAITDPVVEREFGGQPEGFTRELRNPVLCISISEVFERQNACYKLIAGVIEADI